MWPIYPHTEAKWTVPRPDCPHPERWHATDADSTEVEVTFLVAAFVRAIRPDLVVETGTAWGQTASAIGAILAEAETGLLVTYEVDAERVEASRHRCDGLPVEVVQQRSLHGIPELEDGTVGFAWLDSLFEFRAAELEAIAPKLTDGAVVGVHDAGPKYQAFAGEMRETAGALGFSVMQLYTPRGVMFLSRAT